MAARESCSQDDILRELRPRVSQRTVASDTTWLRKQFPDNFRRSSTRGQGRESRVAFTWEGDIPHLVENPITWLDENELVALVAARGMLRDADPSRPATATTLTDHDLLATAVDRFLNRIGVQDAAMLARSVVTVSRFGAAPTDPACLAVCLAATATGEAIECEYRNLRGEKSLRHISPLRLLLVKGEWYVVAWNTELKTFRVERMAHAKRRTDHPVGKPAHIPAREVDALLHDAFFVTKSNKPEDRHKVVLQVQENVWPFIQDRRWGSQTRLQSAADLPADWKRLSFVTTGLPECQYWVLGLGANVRVEGPECLLRWVADQTEIMHRMARQQLDRAIPPPT